MSTSTTEVATPVAPVTPHVIPPVVEPFKADEKDWQAEAEKWKEMSRKHEGSAKSNADKAKAFDAFEESNKTEMQKVADRATAAETQVAELTSRAMRAEVAAAKGIPANLLSGTTSEELEASADALLAFRGAKPVPDMGGGDRGGDVTGKNIQLTGEDVKRLYAEKKYAEIDAASRDGRLDTYLGVKH